MCILWHWSPVNQPLFHEYKHQGLYQTLFCAQSTVCVCKLLFQLCLTLWPHGLYPPGSYVHGILQARILQCVAMASSKGSFWPGIEPVSLTSPTLAGRFFTTSATWEALAHDTISLQNIEALPLSQAGERFQWLFKLFTYNCSTFMKK